VIAPGPRNLHALQIMMMEHAVMDAAADKQLIVLPLQIWKPMEVHRCLIKVGLSGEEEVLQQSPPSISLEDLLNLMLTSPLARLE